jgi:hypothetical protein
MDPSLRPQYQRQSAVLVFSPSTAENLTVLPESAATSHNCCAGRLSSSSSLARRLPASAQISQLAFAAERPFLSAVRSSLFAGPTSSTRRAE